MRTSGDLKYVELESGGYRVAEDWWVEDPALVGWPAMINDGSALIDENGRLTLRTTFRNDGGSFIARDTRNGMEGFAAHDALYRMGRQSKVPPEWRAKADALMYALHRYNGMSWVRANVLWAGVRVGAGPHFKPQADKESKVKVA